MEFQSTQSAKNHSGACVALLLATACWGQAPLMPVAGVPLSVTCEMRVVEAPRATINNLLPKNAYALKEDVLRQLREMVAQKKAVILAQPRITCVSGNQSQTKSVRELIYKSEYEPPQVVAAGVASMAVDQAAGCRAVLGHVNWES